MEIDRQLFGGFGEGHQRIPGFDAVGGAHRQTDIAFPHALAGGEFGGIIVERQSGLVEDPQ